MRRCRIPVGIGMCVHLPVMADGPTKWGLEGEHRSDGGGGD